MNRRETIMNRIRYISQFAAVLAVLTCALLASAAAAAPSFAMVPHPGPPAGTGSAPAEIQTIVAGGMPGWQITLIAVGAALLTATAAVLLDRVRTARQNMTRAAA
jgi:hypothetical protein